MDRILEPEIMADQAQVMAYAKADFRTSSDRFISGFVSTFAEQIQGQNSHILDLGCGPGDIPIALAQIIPKIQITALDASQSMLDLARSRITTAALAHRIHLLQAYLPHWPSPETQLHPPPTAIVSKDMLHHLPDPQVLWRTLQGLASRAATAPATTPIAVYVADLLRPDSPAQAQAIVQAVASQEPPVLQRDFYQSLCAAFTLEEIQQQLSQAQLNLQVSRFGDRHFLASGFLSPP